MKKLLSLGLALLMLLSVMPLTVFAETNEQSVSGTTGDCTWTLDGTKLTISGNGIMANHNYVGTPRPWPSNITEVVIEEGVTHIGGFSFAYCEYIDSITIPKSLESIGPSAFRNSKINRVYIADLESWCKVKFSFNYYYEPENPIFFAQKVYFDGEEITDLVIPDSITEILDYTFFGWKNLKSVKMSDKVVKIGKNAFGKCANLEEIYISKKMETVGAAAFYFCNSLKNVNISDLKAWSQIDFYYSPYWYDGDMETLEPGFINSNPLIYANNLLLNGKVVTEINVPEGVESIGTGAFCGYTKLKKVTFPKGFKSVGDAAFKDTGITEIIMSNDVTHIGELAFSGCKSLTDIQLSGNIKTIGMMAFLNSKAIKNVYYGGSPTDRQKIKYLDVGNYDYSDYPGYKYLHEAAWYYNASNTTLKKINNKWLLYKDGERGYETTLVKFCGKWFYVKKGVWNSNVNLLFKYKGKWFYISNGKWNKNINGLKYANGIYVYVKNGKWDKSKTGFVSKGGSKCYVKNGVMVEKTQFLNYNGKTYYLKDGVRSTYTGIMRHNGKWYYLKNGIWSKEKAIVRYKPQKVKIRDGLYIYSYYLADYKGELFYVNNGYAQLSFSGKVTVDGKTYKIKNGIVV
jgi:hypothetical protein